MRRRGRWTWTIPAFAAPSFAHATKRGLFGKPIVINNVETLANIPWIVSRGADAYRALGFSSSRGTKVVSLNSLFNRPGLYEVEFGVPVRHIVEDLGGGLRGGTLKGVMIGGPLAGVLPPDLLTLRSGSRNCSRRAPPGLRRHSSAREFRRGRNSGGPPSRNRLNLPTKIQTDSEKVGSGATGNRTPIC